MDRLNSDRTIKDLVALTRGDIPGQVDALVDAYLVGTDPGQLWQRRAELAHEFLNAAPFSELSYRIWRRIAGEDDNGEMMFQARSMEFLPPVEFQMAR
ncbi:MAG TPA: hypothetical protein VHY10_17710 [Xanthobacteraceae bacterium]|jgi:hypothetical protein|nr:hypothetical protein [Xanthobacteraceae bacterium]